MTPCSDESGMIHGESRSAADTSLNIRWRRSSEQDAANLHSAVRRTGDWLRGMSRTTKSCCALPLAAKLTLDGDVGTAPLWSAIWETGIHLPLPLAAAETLCRDAASGHASGIAGLPADR